MAEAKRSLIAHYIDSTPSATADTWELLGEGISALTMNYNPQSTTEQYIHEDNATTLLDSYQPNVPIDMVVYPGDDAFDYIDSIRQGGPFVDAANTVTELVEVRLYETPDTSGNQYPGTKWQVQIQIDSFGGDGGAKGRIGFTLNIQGDPVDGDFNVSTLAWTDA